MSPPFDQFKLEHGTPIQKLRAVEPELVAVYRKDVRRMMGKDGFPKEPAWSNYLDNEDIVGHIDKIIFRATGMHTDMFDEKYNNALINITERAFDKAVLLEGGKVMNWKA